MSGMVRALVLIGVVGLASALVWETTCRAEEKEPVIAGEGARGVFLRAVHGRAHRAWAEDFRRDAAARLPPSHPLNDVSRSVTLAMTLISDGTLVESRVERSSGLPELDAAALALLPPGSVFSQPPDEALSDDGRAHLRWTFARDRRGCSGVEIIIQEGPLAEAVARLLAHGRDRETLRRIRVAALSSPDTAVTVMARLWLERALEQTVQAVPAAIGLAGVRDARGIEILRSALARGERVDQVTVALARLERTEPAVAPGPMPARVPTEALLKLLHKDDRRSRREAAAALVARSDGPARRALGALVRHADPELRLFAAVTLGARERAALIAAVGADGREAYRLLVRGQGRGAAGEWLLAQFERLPPPIQVEVLSEWLWGMGESPPVTLSVR